MELIVSDKPFYRQSRLCDTFIYAQSRIPHELYDRIVALEDQKGALTIHWNVAPTDEEREAFQWAWERVGEQGSSLIHLQGHAQPIT